MLGLSSRLLFHNKRLTERRSENWTEDCKVKRATQTNITNQNSACLFVFVYNVLTKINKNSLFHQVVFISNVMFTDQETHAHEVHTFSQLETSVRFTHRASQLIETRVTNYSIDTNNFHTNYFILLYIKFKSVHEM